MPSDSTEKRRKASNLFPGETFEEQFMKLTTTNVRNLVLADDQTDKIFRDSDLAGFGYRLRRTGAGINRSWVIQYRIGRAQRRISLDANKFTIEAARREAKAILAKATLGIDAAVERNKLREEASAVKLTLGDIAARYLSVKADVLRQSTLGAAKRYFHRDFAKLMPRPVAEIARSEIAASLQDIIKQTGRTAAARARSTLSTLYVWALKEGLIENSQNPVALVNDPLAGIDNSRDRVLTDAELVKVWNTCRDDDFGRIIKLLILSGCRRDEIGSLRWSEIDLDAGTLPEMALDILRGIQRRDGRDFVFGRSGQGFQRWGACTTALRKRLGEMPLFTLHDLRRTFRTGLGRLGIPSHIAELAINHTRQGIQAVYDRHTYQHEIASALASWTNHISVILGGRADTTVVNLKRIPR
jgi:integrase